MLTTTLMISNSLEHVASARATIITHIKAETKKEEIRVCTNRTCRRQGSVNTLDLIKNLVPPNVDVKSCGCLGRCGNGPNVAILPNGILIGHCSTPAHAARLVLNAFGGDVGDVDNCLEVLSIRMKAQAEMDRGEFSEADRLLSKAIDLKPWGGIHMIYKNRSRARLAMGNYTGALEDAKEALALSPQDTEAYICEGDALMAMEQYTATERSYSVCLDIDPSIRRSKSFKARVARLQEKLITAETYGS